MGLNKSGIEWTDDTWNPVVGCRRGCWYCYARELATTRLAKMPNACPRCATFEPHIHPERIFQPLQRKKPTTIFVGSMSGMWGGWVPKDWIESVLQVIAACPQHTFLTLTKNPKRYFSIFPLAENLWCGVTITGSGDVERIETADLLIPSHQPHFLSFEPLLDDAEEIHKAMGLDYIGDATHWDAFIIGPLNKKGHPPVTERKWVERIIEIAQAAEVPVFLKKECVKIGYTMDEMLERNLRQLPWTVKKKETNT